MKDKLFPLAVTILLLVIAALLVAQTFYPVGRYQPIQVTYMEARISGVIDTRTGTIYAMIDGKQYIMNWTKAPKAPEKK